MRGFWNVFKSVMEKSVYDTNDDGVVDSAASATPTAHDMGGALHNAMTLSELNAKVSDGTLDKNSDTRTPASHATAHKSGGGDAIKLDELAAPTDITTLDFTTSAHGLVPKGTNAGDFLKDDGSWATPSATAGFSSRCRVYRTTSAQAIDSGAWTKVQFNAEDYDGDNEFDSATNYRFTAGSAGYYLVNVHLRINNLNDQNLLQARIYHNGAAIAHSTLLLGQAGDADAWVTDVVYLAATDYIEGYVNHNYGSSRSVYNHTDYTWMSIHRLS